MDFKKKRWICLIAAMIIDACTGITYAWSVFVSPLMEQFHCTSQQANLVYTTMFWCSAIGTLFIVSWAKRNLSINKCVLIGTLVYVLSVITASFSTSYWMFWFFFGVMKSLGAVLVYPVLISYSVELFPEKSGMSSGLISAGYACGSVIWAPLANSLMESFGSVTAAIRILGIIFAICMIPLTFLLRDVPKDFKDLVVAPGSSIKRKSVDFGFYNVNRNQMIKMGAFYVALIGLVLAMSGGNMIVSQGAPILKDILAFSAAQAASIVAVMSICNVAGRLACGVVSDKLGKTKTMALSLIITAIAICGMIIIRANAVFIGCMLLTVFCYGGQASLVAPITAEVFGKEIPACLIGVHFVRVLWQSAYCIACAYAYFGNNTRL